MKTRWRETALSAALAGGMVLTPVASANVDRVQDTSERPAILIHTGGIDSILVDERDQALRSALHMIGPRLGELPRQIDEPDVPPAGLLRFVGDVLMRPMTLRGTVLEDIDPRHGPPFGLQLLVRASSEEAAKQEASLILDVIRQQIGPEAIGTLPTNRNISLIANGPTQFMIGSAKVAENPVMVLALNTLELEPTPLPDVGLPAGVRPAFAMHFDTGTFAPLLDGMLEQAPQQQRELLRSQFQMMGILGENPLVMSMAIGHGDEYAHFGGRFQNYTNNELYGMLISSASIDREALLLVPEDASMVQVGTAKLSSMGSYFRTLMRHTPEGEQMGDPFAMIEAQTGINLERDLLAHLGEQTGYYTSDTTGGGGLLSMVSFVEVTDTEALNTTLDRITVQINQFADQMAKGFVEFRKQAVNGVNMTTLTFPGLPVPLEICYTISDGYLFAAASQQALVGAIYQQQRGDRSIINNERFRSTIGDRYANAMQVQFLDTPRLLKSGYGMMTLLASAISNGVKSPEDADRTPGLVLPPYPVLARNAKPMANVTTIDGNDLVIQGRMDRSMLVNMTGIVGAIGTTYTGVALAALGAGVTMPAMAKARESALEAKSMSNLRQLGMAIQLYVQEHNGAMPESVDQLIESGYITPAVLQSPVGPVTDKGGSYFLRLNGEQRSLGGADVVVGYDRAMLGNQFKTVVLFGDGHVEHVSYERLMALLERENNAGVDFNLPPGF